ncbi:MAG: HRDC domain-containing protein, partial [Planctomycetaceae bacterium]
PHQWERYRLLREFRKQVTTRDGLPAYAMALNDQLAEIVTRCPVSLAELSQVAGFGQARVEKYGPMLLEQLRVASESFPDPPASSPATSSPPSPAAAPPPSPAVTASTSPAT